MTSSTTTPDALEDFINACSDTIEDLMTLECASNVGMLSLKDGKAEPGPFGPSSCRSPRATVPASSATRHSERSCV